MKKIQTEAFQDASAGSSPEGWPQDAVADDEVEFLQVGGGSLLQHAVALQAVVALRQPSGHLQQKHFEKSETEALKSLTGV